VALGTFHPQAQEESCRARREVLALHLLGNVEGEGEGLLITPSELERRGESLLVRGRVYARSRELGIRDIPVAWIWAVREGRFVRGEVFSDPEQAMVRFAAVEQESSLS
jgi:hypothetical protein